MGDPACWKETRLCPHTTQGFNPCFALPSRGPLGKFLLSVFPVLERATLSTPFEAWSAETGAPPGCGRARLAWCAPSRQQGLSGWLPLGKDQEVRGGTRRPQCESQWRAERSLSPDGAGYKNHREECIVCPHLAAPTLVFAPLCFIAVPGTAFTSPLGPNRITSTPALWQPVSLQTPRDGASRLHVSRLCLRPTSGLHSDSGCSRGSGRLTLGTRCPTRCSARSWKTP